MAFTDWNVKGLGFMSCNCDYGCPCQFSALPKDNICEAVTGMVIEDGHFGDTGLSGLQWVTIWAWPNPIHEGNGTMQMIIDQRADDDQRAALVEILHGRETEPGATILQIFSATLTKTYDPLFLPIELKLSEEERTATIRVPEQVQLDMEPIRNPVTGDPQRIRINLPDGFEYTNAEIASGTFHTQGEIKLNYADRHAHIAKLHMTQSGVVR
ncbi:MAG: DUF1326 domain-containing protein [Rhodospirillaceae bacterium]|jgi:hypothetical protein|nr:DUF1326 domain-containing protein [Rhodospirillaceae bacterium]MBT5752636.1 DUF1326 domain-containing protein [Rhodospirillaceae bacterium]